MTFDPRAAARAIVGEAKDPQPNGAADQNWHVRPGDSFSDLDLMTGEIAEPIFIVDGLAPEGLIILAGRPKMGKTTLAMNLANAVARGGLALGVIQCQQHDVLFLALEDNRRRLQKRRRMMLQAEGLQGVKELRFELSWPRLDEEGGLEKLDDACRANPKLKLIIIDTWKRISPRRKKDQNDYEHESAAAGLLQKLAAKHQITIIIIHHSRKGIGSEDFVDDVLGSTGLTGGVDTIIGFRRKRGTSEAEISIAGRDLDECEKALAGDQSTGLWRLLGDAADHRRSRQRNAIINLLRDGKIRKATDIADLLGEKYDATRKTCARMADDGQLVKIGTGYSLP